MFYHVLRIKSKFIISDDINRNVLQIFNNCALNYKSSILAIKNFESTIFAILTSRIFDTHMKCLASSFFINLLFKSNQAKAYLNKLNVNYLILGY